MNHWFNGKRLTACALALVMIVSMLCICVSAVGVDEAKASLATVEITQVYNTQKTSSGVHDYRTDGKNVYITYSATLQMTDIMAEYLQPRQAQLYDAQFNVNMNVDLSLLEFDTSSDTLTFTFTSTFLKPCATRAIPSLSYKLVSMDGGVFTYELSVDRVWAEAQRGTITVPMELIVYADRSRAYGFDEAIAAGYGAERVMFSDFSVSDWQHEIKLTLAEMKVRDDVAKTVTTDAFTWKTVKAYGTVDGEFSYITADVPTDLSHAAALSGNPEWQKTLAFGNNADITEWVSNEVRVLLKRTDMTKPSGSITPGDLNTEDHFAYVIGYKDGMVHPERNVTRAEVATIFFRMLKDESRNKYWSKTNSFSDVSATAWYNNAISTLTNMGVISGYPDGTFRPNAGITRAEFAKIAVSFFDVNVDQTLGTNFTDVAGAWYTKYINLAVELNIVNGYADGTFRPNNLITRAEAMKIVNNTLRRTPHKDRLLPEKDMITWPDNMDKNVWYYAVVQEATNSHDYDRVSITDYEQWTAPLPVRDWAKFEREWSDANSAVNPGEVVDGTAGLGGR